MFFDSSMTTPCHPEFRKKLVLEMDARINNNKVIINNNKDFPGSLQSCDVALSVIGMKR